MNVLLVFKEVTKNFEEIKNQVTSQGILSWMVLTLGHILRWHTVTILLRNEYISGGNMLKWIINWLSRVATGKSKVVNGYRWNRKVTSDTSVGVVFNLI